MKILVIGTGSSPFVKEPIQFALANGKNNIYVTYNEQKDIAYLDFYKENNINVINTHDRKNILGRVPKLGVLYNIWIAVRRAVKTGKFNLIHIHSMNNYIMILFSIRVLSKYSNRVICTFYGSDLLLKTDKQLRQSNKIQKYKKRLFSYVSPRYYMNEKSFLVLLLKIFFNDLSFTKR